MPLIILFFFVVSITYGVVTETDPAPGRYSAAADRTDEEHGGFIVMVFPLSQFVAFFNWSNMGKFMAVGLTDMLESAGMTGAPAFIGLMFLSAFLCMFIASGSAIWSILAPIFVPMFMLLGFHPAFAQMIFRIADSSVLPLAPMSPFLPLFLGFLQRYRKDAQLGTYYSLIMPYPLVFFSGMVPAAAGVVRAGPADWAGRLAGHADPGLISWRRKVKRGNQGCPFCFLADG